MVHSLVRVDGTVRDLALDGQQSLIGEACDDVGLGSAEFALSSEVVRLRGVHEGFDVGPGGVLDEAAGAQQFLDGVFLEFAGAPADGRHLLCGHQRCGGDHGTLDFVTGWCSTLGDPGKAMRIDEAKDEFGNATGVLGRVS